MEGLIEQPDSRFVKIECKNCGNAQVVFDHASTKVKCLVCDSEIAEPTGGKARITAKINRSF